MGNVGCRSRNRAQSVEGAPGWQVRTVRGWLPDAHEPCAVLYYWNRPVLVQHGSNLYRPEDKPDVIKSIPKEALSALNQRAEELRC